MRALHDHLWRGLLLLVALWLGAAAQADEWVSGRVVAVTDGDTAVVETARREALRVRFYGIDAPESANADWPAQAYAAESTRFMRELIDGKQVRVRLTGERTYKREVGEIFLREQSASAASVAAGMAWWNKKFARKDRRLEQLQIDARAARRGLWRERNPVPPWEHRARYRSRHRH